MSILNIFKKSNTTAGKAVVETMDKSNLKSIIGGGAINTTRSNIKSPTIVDGGTGTEPTYDPSGDSGSLINP